MACSTAYPQILSRDDMDALARTITYQHNYHLRRLFTSDAHGWSCDRLPQQVGKACGLVFVMEEDSLEDSGHVTAFHTDGQLRTLAGPHTSQSAPGTFIEMTGASVGGARAKVDASGGHLVLGVGRYSRYQPDASRATATNSRATGLHCTKTRGLSVGRGRGQGRTDVSHRRPHPPEGPHGRDRI
mmetsp:Transcript_382/g.1137  ORF Transcript_382/g.1137 Transcript_382/m.1137 type:complete len:185 (+) Transcript_382:273-827(+)